MSGGFSIIPHWMIRESDFTDHELLVYIALLSRADRYGRCWPSMKTIARESRRSETTVRRTLESLEARGVVTVQRRPQAGRPHQSNVYVVRVFDRQAPSGQGGCAGRTLGVQGDTREGAPLTPEVDPLQVDPDEADMTSNLQAGPTTTAATNDAPAMPATRRQREYIDDLWIHYYGQPPSTAMRQQLDQLSVTEASELIASSLRDMPRALEYVGPEPGEAAYEALSAVGRTWADQAMIPGGSRQ